MGRFADDAFRALDNLPFLAWLAWITFGSPATTLIGLVLIGAGIFGNFGNASGSFELPGGPKASGSIRYLLIAGGLAIYIGGGALVAGSPPHNVAVDAQLLGAPN